MFGMRNSILWTYSPISVEVLNLDKWRTTVYHCVDEIKAMPGMPIDTLARAEQKLIERADIVFVTSVTLEKSRRPLNPRTYYFPNVADFDHFSRALDESTEVPADLAGIAYPRIGFIGAISGYKINFPLIKAVAEAHPEWSIVLIGQVGEGDPRTDTSELAALSNVHMIGPRPYGKLPAYLKGFDVALLPNQLNDYTAAMFPMKFFEYMAAGRPVVSVDLPSLEDYADTVTLAKTTAGFIEGIENALARGTGQQQQRVDLARQHTYMSRTERMLALVAEVSV